ncbi:hypothetical protein NX059_012127 [Plenodomus lindquistii]|nr:hypothetical protein NX059_012139 [Plenodomus lindquistii]KAI8930757.1 hypothetical protein NX059_012365 [Plenodomus lindquistii]KAI8931117.1 hypothetical protein NX059_012127 [Plenodomus lindquistii]
MQLSVVKALLGLLAFRQVLGTAYAYPNQGHALADDVVLLQESQLDEGTDEETWFEKRATDPPLTNWGQGPGTTWSGFVKQPANSQWTTDTIDEYAVNAWRQTSPPALVAALWVPGVGVYLGSIPHGTEPTGITVQAAFDGRLRTQAPVLWGQVKDRTYQGTSKWHAEDMAMTGLDLNLLAVGRTGKGTGLLPPVLKS